MNRQLPERSSAGDERVVHPAGGHRDARWWTDHQVVDLAELNTLQRLGWTGSCPGTCRQIFGGQVSNCQRYDNLRHRPHPVRSVDLDFGGEVCVSVPDSRVLAGYLLDQQHPLTQNWVSPADRFDALARELVADITMMTDLDFATWRRDLFAPELPVEVMLDRWVIVTDDLQAMLSMRYEGGDVALPFVQAIVLSRAVDSVADLHALAAATVAVYGVLGPHYLRAWSAKLANHFPATRQDKRFLAAPLDMLRRTPLPPGLSASPTADLARYDQAYGAYQAVDAKHPHHSRQAAIETRDALEESRQSGTLFDVLIDGVWSGYIAATAGGRLGLPGFTIRELVLVESARGRSLGRYLSPLLARALPDSHGVLIGTVHHDNIGARCAALNAGRIDVGGWFTVALGLSNP